MMDRRLFVTGAAAAAGYAALELLMIFTHYRSAIKSTVSVTIGSNHLHQC